MQKTWWCLGIGVIVALVVLGGTMLFVDERETDDAALDNDDTTQLPPREGAASFCLNDNDCVPASCCHARTCVAASEKPTCKGVYCTQVCEPETLDCGQARCSCIQQRCVVVPE